uniref:Neurofibromin n=1 Tax=Eptatretus burgeri TaxID=7764 RepID=A0A8C4R3X7_EPTBU
MTPWLGNLVRFCKHADETRRQRVCAILDKLIATTIHEKQMYPSIQAKIWGSLGQITDLLDVVLDSFMRTSATGGLGSVRAEVMADTSVALASGNVKLVSSKVIGRMSKIIEKTSLSPTPTLEQHLMWDDIAILARYLLMLSFNNSLDVATHLPHLFHVVTLLVATGPLSLRASTHGLVINVIHSLCTCSQLNFSEETRQLLRLSVTEFCLPKFKLLFGISKVKSAAVIAFRSSYRDRSLSPGAYEREPFALSSLELLTDALIEIMEACMTDQPSCRWLEQWIELAQKFAFQFNPSLQPRALVVFGCISRSAYPRHIRKILQIHCKALERCQRGPDSDNNLALIEGTLICLSRLLPLLPTDFSVQGAMLWVAIAAMQLDEVSLYGAGTALLEQTLHTLDNHGAFNDRTPEEVFMEIRFPLEWHCKQMEYFVGLSFTVDFNFALVGHLLKGFRHPNHSVTARTVRILHTLLALVAKSRKADRFEVTPQSIAYLAALVTASEEVRGRCGLRHRKALMVGDSLEFFSLQLISDPSTPSRPGEPQPWSLQPPAAPAYQSSLRNRKSMSVDLGQPCPVTNKKLFDAQCQTGQAHLRKVSAADTSVLFDEQTLPNARTQALLLTVLATLVKYTPDELEQKILYEYLAEASRVFSRVFPVVHNLLDGKLITQLALCPDPVLLSPVHNILQSVVCHDDTAPQYTPSFLQSFGFGGLWRIAGPFSKQSQITDYTELIVKFLESLIATYLLSGDGEEEGLLEPPVPPPLSPHTHPHPVTRASTLSPVPSHLSTSLSSLSAIQAPAEPSSPTSSTGAVGGEHTSQHSLSKPIQKQRSTDSIRRHDCKKGS